MGIRLALDVSKEMRGCGYRFKIGKLNLFNIANAVTSFVGSIFRAIGSLFQDVNQPKQDLPPVAVTHVVGESSSEDEVESCSALMKIDETFKKLKRVGFTPYDTGSSLSTYSSSLSTSLEGVNSDSGNEGLEFFDYELFGNLTSPEREAYAKVCDWGTANIEPEEVET